MATKKPGESRARGADAQAFTIVLEDLRAQFGVFGEALQGMREHMDNRFEAVDRRFDEVDRRFDEVDKRFEAVDGRLEGLNARLDRTERDLGLVKAAVLENSRELKGVVQAVAGVVSEKVGRAEVEAIVERALQRPRR
jgi:predicted  nucleic acid-binding Zn-ribbon protein